jgi:hypothetical protein
MMRFGPLQCKFGILSAMFAFDLNTVDMMAAALSCWGKPSA